MGARGPAPFPREKLIANGLRGKQKLRDDEPQPRRLTSLPPPPESLEPPAAEFWAEYGEKGIRDRILSDVDLPALERLCQSWWRIQVLEDDIAEHGSVQKVPKMDGSGVIVAWTERARPQVGMLKEAEAQFNRCLQAFGWTPSSRTRVQTIQEGKGAGVGGQGASEAERLMEELEGMQAVAGVEELPC